MAKRVEDSPKKSKKSPSVPEPAQDAPRAEQAAVGESAAAESTPKPSPKPGKRGAKRAGPPRVAIVAGLRSPFAKQSTALRELSALELGRRVVSELLARLPVDPAVVERVVFGQVLPSIDAPNIAREIVLGTALPPSTDAFSVSRACATSLQATACIAESILSGDIQVGLAGGADSASIVPVTVSPHFAATLLALSKAKGTIERLRLLAKLRPVDLLPVPPAVKEPSTGLSMGEHAEQMAKDHGITREAQEDLARRSHRLASEAWRSGRLAQEVMPFFEPNLDEDNLIRHQTVEGDYARLRPAFDRKHGSITAATSSALTDGAAAVLLMSEQRAAELGVEVLGYLRSWAFAALDVRRDMLMGPAYAAPLALDRAGVTLAQLELVEMHEAFAAQVLCNLKAFADPRFAREELQRAKPLGEVDMQRFNVLGGSLAYGHPFAATGARMLTQTVNELRRRGGGLALISTCAAGGLGGAMVLEVS